MYSANLFGNNTNFGVNASTTTLQTPSLTNNFKPACNAFTSSFGTPFQANVPPFGQPASNVGNIFGSNTNTSQPLFGVNNTRMEGGKDIFGACSFGVQPSLSLNAANSTSSVFGAPKTPQSNVFGQVFGSLAAPKPGTTVKFIPVCGSDTMLKTDSTTETVNIHHQCITCMTEYEGKSFEELRLEDYSLNPEIKNGKFYIKTCPTCLGTQATNSQSELFQNKSPFGEVGSTASFGKPGFGNGFNIFNKPSQNTSMQPNSIFGANQSANWSNVSQTIPQPISSEKPQPFTNSQSNLFSSRPSFNSMITPAISNCVSNPSFALPFGSKFNAPSFGQSSSANTGFKMTKPLTGFNFAPTQPSNPASGMIGNGFFANQAAQNQTPSFISPRASSWTLNPISMNGFRSPNTFTSPSISSYFSNNAQTRIDPKTQLQNEILRITTKPFGDSPLFRFSDSTMVRKYKSNCLKPQDFNRPTAAEQQKTRSQERVSVSKTKLNPKLSATPNSLDDPDINEAIQSFVRRKSVKSLIIGECSGKARDGSNVILDPHQNSSEQSASSGVNWKSDKTLPNNIADGTHEKGKDENGDENEINGKVSPDAPPKESSNQNGHCPEYPATDETCECISEHGKYADILTTNRGVLTGLDYYTIPSWEEMYSLVDEGGNCFVENLVVARKGYGKVFFPGRVNMANLKLDEIIFIRRKEIVVYPDETKKPPVGQGLNRKARITLECVWPVDKTSHEIIRNPEKLDLIGYAEKIESSTVKIGASFIDYTPETGSWVFSVKHF